MSVEKTFFLNCQKRASKGWIFQGWVIVSVGITNPALKCLNSVFLLTNSYAKITIKISNISEFFFVISLPSGFLVWTTLWVALIP